MGDMDLKNLELDKKELEEIHSLSTSENVKSLIHDYIVNLNSSINSLIKTHEKEEQMKKIEQEVENFNVISKYSWLDGNKSIKIYINNDDFKDIDSHSKDKVDIQFNLSAIELKVYSWKGKNYKFVLKDLVREYDRSNSSFKLTKSGITIILKKNKEEPWMQLIQK